MEPFGTKGGRHYVERIAAYCRMTEEQLRAAWKAWKQERLLFHAEWGARVMKHWPEAEAKIAEGTDIVAMERRVVKQRTQKHSKEQLHPVRRWLNLRGLNEIIFREMNGTGTQDPIDRESANYITGPMVRGWLNGRVVPWEQGGQVFSSLAAFMQYDADLLREDWQDWLDGKLILKEGKIARSE